MKNSQINFCLIMSYIKNNKLTIKDFCNHCRISRNVYYKIKNNKNVLFISIFKIAKELKISASKLFIS